MILMSNTNTYTILIPSIPYTSINNNNAHFVSILHHYTLNPSSSSIAELIDVALDVSSTFHNTIHITSDQTGIILITITDGVITYQTEDPITPN